MRHKVLSGWVLVLVLLGILGGAPAGPRVGAAAAPDLVAGSMLVFESERYNTWDVFSANDDGSNQQRLTTHVASDLYPRANRGYTRIAFASPRDTNNYNIFVMNTDGSGVTQLMTTLGEDVSPAWSPDGTRIAYASNRDGNYDIFVMDADGSNGVKLTTDAASDAAPDWSPAGTQIAFVSQRSGGFRVWKMGSDGSGQAMLSTQNKSQNPAWSPDGTQIAFDADADGDGWNELWIMNADGSGEQLLHEPGTNAEAKDPSWSPDGRYIAFSYVQWIYQGDVWVASAQDLRAYDTANPGTIVTLVADSGRDRNPNWQTVDILAPTTSVNALPALSTGPFTVSWGGYDNGPAGLCRYDVQYRDGSGSWTDWFVQTTATSAPFPGVGGHTYYFQVRARDCAYNYEAYPGGDGDTHTLVEPWPPESAVDALPSHYRGTQIQVTWAGRDAGSSGIAFYDVQYKDGSGAWTNWQMETTATAATFSGSSGHTYSFRCRATDNAENVESWPAGDGDTSVTFYTWAVSGIARDNRETLLAGVSANTTPAAFQVLPSSLDGEYSSYAAAAAGAYEVSWTKTGHTDLPSTTLGAADASFDIILPPGDNVVQDWGFESGQLDPEWLAAGTTLPGITGTVQHTGDYAALLGCQYDDFAAPYNVSNSPGTSAMPMIATDGSGNLHVAWYQNDTSIPGEIYYARRVGNTWQPPDNLSNSPVLAESPRIAVDGNGTVHVVWTEDTAGGTPEIYYARREASTWSAPVNVSLNAGSSRDPQLAVQSNGTVHVLWRDTTATPGVYNVYYAQRTTSWTTPLQLSSSATSVDGPRLAVDGGGIAHAVWGAGEIYYARRDGSWSTPTAISAGSGAASMARLALHGSEVHVLWIETLTGSNGVYYARYSGSWSAPVNVFSSASALSEPQVAVDGSAALHAVWRTGTGTASEIYYALRSGGTWSAAENISNSADESSAPQLGTDGTNAAHVVWVDKSAGNYEIAYRDRNGGVWSPLKSASRNAGKSDQPSLLVEGSQAVHAVWIDASWGAPLVLHGQATMNTAAGDSQISQRITVTSGWNAPTLSFLYILDGASPSTGSSLSVQVTDSGGTTTLLSTNASVNDWAHRWFDLSAWAGEAITLTIKVTQAADRLCTWGYLDEITLGGAYPDLWVAKTGGAAGLPGTNVVYHITYGNRGGAAAAAALITDALPAELAYLAADPPPDSTAPLTWNPGTLPALGGPYEIVLTVTVQPGAVPWTTYTNTIAIFTSTPEAETANNAAYAATLIAARVYLPLVGKLW